MPWDIDPILFRIGPLGVRTYTLLFIAGLLTAFSMLRTFFVERGYPRGHAIRIALWTSLGMLLGAHFVHLVFYEPESFWRTPRRILELGTGLASHGGGLGALLALGVFCRKHAVPFHRYADPCSVAAMCVVPAVRVGNFFNSEIYGLPTDLPWGVVFVRRGLFSPRHPTQLYEALIGFVVLSVVYVVYQKKGRYLRQGTVFYLTLWLYFSTRFLVEFVKDFDLISSALPITMGQALSVPPWAFATAMLYVRRPWSIGHIAESDARIGKSRASQR